MFEYDQPTSHRDQGVKGNRPSESSDSFRAIDLFHLLTRRILTIALASLACTCAAIIIGKSLTPRYAATAQLYVDPRELQLVERELTPRSQDLSGLAMVVESQARLITSNNVLSKVIGDLSLERDPEFGGKSARGFLSGLLSFGTDASLPPSSAKATALDALREHVNVKRTDRTFIVDIEVASREPAKAALLANAIADAYLKESKDSQAAAARRATTDLSGRLKELQERLRTAENDLAVYKSKNNFVGTQDTQVSDQQLSSGTQRLANAQAATLDALARYNQIEASRKTAADSGAMPEALQSPTIASLRTQYADARRRQAELLSELGPLHPALRMISKQVEDARRNIDEEVDRFAQSANNDLTRARALEASLTKAFEGQKRQSADLGQASVQLRELEREVEASRTVYQSFLKRSRETEEQETLNTSSARIIGEATAPQRRVFPPAMSVLAILGLMLGAIGSTGWIVIADRLSSAAAGGGSKPDPVTPPVQKPGSRSFPGLPRPQAGKPTTQAAGASLREPLRFSLKEADVLRTLNGIFPLSGTSDILRLGWPILNVDASSAAFVDAARRIFASAKECSPKDSAPVLAVTGMDCDHHRTVVALNLALALARGGARVLLIDADGVHRALSNRLGARPAQRKPSVWFGTAAQQPVKIMSGVAIQSAVAMGDAAAGKALKAARLSGAYDLVLLDGPAIPPNALDREVLKSVDGIIAITPRGPSDGLRMKNTRVALGEAESKLMGIVLTELEPNAPVMEPARKSA
jgi:uncharacterized protein involved in exopolysaccharide biosynthesis/Mrp family chromosome partitioning ATPase